MLVEINLLPWRQYQRNKEKKKWIVITVISFLLTSFICLLIHYDLYLLNHLQIQRIQYLKKEIAIVKVQIREIEKIKKRREMLLTQILFLQKIQNDCYLIMHLLDELTRLMPEEVSLNRLQRKGKKIILQGITHLNDKVTSLMDNINRNKWMENPNIIEIKNDVNSNKKIFNVSFIIKKNNNK